MKKLFLLFLTIFTFAFFSGCDLDDDGYSLDNAWVGFGLVSKDASGSAYTIVMDDGEVLFPGNYVDLALDLKNNDRVLVNFTILGNKDNPDHNEYYYVRINSLRKILYKGIFDITPAKEDSIGNDPLTVKDHWIKGNILNFEIRYYGGNQIHYINLVKQPGPIDTSGGPVLLELRHNNRDDNGEIPLSGFASFDLSALKIQGKNSTPFKVTAKNFDGKTFEFTGEYKY